METAEFRKTIEKNLVRNKPVKLGKNVAGLRTAIDKLYRDAGRIGLDSSEVSAACRRLIDKAEQTWMHDEYGSLTMEPLLKQTQPMIFYRKENDPSEIEMKPATKTFVTETGLSMKVDIPVFAHVWNSFNVLVQRYGKEQSDGATDYHGFHSRFKFDAGRMSHTRGKHGSHGSRNVEISVSVPTGITDAMFVRLRKCISRLAMFDTMCLVHGVINKLPDMGDVQVGVLWAPTDETWAVRHSAPRPLRGDPALLVRREKNDGIPYLVNYFDTPDEKKVDHIIREFSTGKFNK